MNKCYYCPEEFMTEDEMVQHLFSTHGDQFQMGSAQLAEIAGRQIFAGKLQTSVSVAASLTSTYFQTGKRDDTEYDDIMGIHERFSRAVMGHLMLEELTADLVPFVEELAADGESDKSEG